VKIAQRARTYPSGGRQRMSLSGQSPRAIARTHGVRSDLDLRAHYMSKALGVPFPPCLKRLLYLLQLSSNQRWPKVTGPPMYVVISKSPLSSSGLQHAAQHSMDKEIQIQFNIALY